MADDSYFREPVVFSNKGGKTGGGAQLTATGRAVLDRYRRMETKARRVVAPDLATLATLAARTR